MKNEFGFVERFLLGLGKAFFGFLLVIVLGVCGAFPAVAVPMGNLLGQPVREVKVSLGSGANELRFFPENLQFVVGQRYKLVLDNPSPQKHYFTSKDFADAIWTQKVEAGKVEIKGDIREVELKPGAEAEWVFVPVKPGIYSLRCPIAGHTEAGMIGKIRVSVEESV